MLELSSADHILSDSGAQIAFVSEPLLPVFAEIYGTIATLRGIIVSERAQP